MKATNNELISQLKEKLVAASQDEIQRVIQEAQDEAIQEAKNLLKERMLDGILRHAIEKNTPKNGKVVDDKKKVEDSVEKEAVAK